MAEDGDYIRSLVAEARGMKVKPMPSAIKLAWDHPNPLTYDIKTEQQYEDGQRKDYVLRRLAEKYPGGEGIRIPDLQQEVSDYSRGKLKDVGSPFYHRGLYTPGSPVHSVFSYMSSFPSMAYNASAMAANAMDPDAPFDPDAKRKWDSSFNTAFAYLPEYMGLVPTGTRTYADAANDVKYSRQEVPWESLEAAKNEDAAAHAAEASQQIGGMYTGGKEHYMRQGMPEVPAMFAGAFTDSLMDPYAGWMSAAKLARQGQKARALKDVGWEWGLGQTMAGISALERATRPTSMLQADAR